MNKKDLRIVYMGTPDFAVAPLDNLISAGYTIVGVITVADKPAGRGRKLRQSPVKVYAEEKGLRILQPTNLKDPKFIEELSSLKADLQIVVAFRMLPEIVWDMPEMGTFNLHASLLPNYRGAAPINWAIINGEEYTGVSTFFLEHTIDTGNILLQEKIGINNEDSAGSLHDKLMIVGAKLVVETVDGILASNLKAKPQAELLDDNINLREAPKIHKADCKIDFLKSSKQVYDFVRGLSPYPAAFTEIKLANGETKKLKIYSCKPNTEKGEEGNIEVRDGKVLAFTKDGALEILELQLEGKKRMLAEDFLRGTKLA